jgi:KAP family P-loop domain
MSDQDKRTAIWEGDRLGRRQEAETIEKFLVKEIEVFRRLGRDQSIVLGIDAPYGRGKSCFLERLAKQLGLSHPVARIDAWADDVGDEPLTAFMASIDDALAPYLTVSKKLSDRMAAAKAAALPVIGKLVTGVLVKAMSKVAGDEIEDQLGTVAAYRQRKQSRQLFRQNMRDLVSAIEQNDGAGSPPLIVIIDELDRCRPNYAIRMLEEIKHFFEVPGVVFILGLHGGQLSKSVSAVYGAEFDSEDYLRRFFTRRYELRTSHIVELAAAVFEEWGIDEKKFAYPDPTVGEGYNTTNPRIIGLILSEWEVTPREVYPIMDGLRLFVDGWEHPDPIEPIAILSLLVQLVRGQLLNFVQQKQLGHISLKGISWISDSAGNPSQFTFDQYLRQLHSIAWKPLSEVRGERRSNDPAKNYLVEWMQNEWNTRCARSPGQPPLQSHFADYIPRICDLARFIDK